MSPVAAQTVQELDNGSVATEAVIDLTNLVPSSEGKDADAAISDEPLATAAETISVIDEILAEIDDDAVITGDISETEAESVAEAANPASPNLDANVSSEVGASDTSIPETDAPSQTDTPATTVLSEDNSLESGESSTEMSLDASAPEQAEEQTAQQTEEQSEEQTAQQPTEQASNEIQSAPAVQPAARVGRRELSNIGLVSIGLEDANVAGKQLNSLIWQGSEAQDILALMAQTPAYGPSAEMNKLLLSALLRQAVPPRGAAQMADEMVDARLSWLADAGQSDALAQLIRKLPGDEAWQTWQHWLVEYDLFTGQDEEACRQVELAVGSTLEPFWHQAQVVCQILSGDNLLAGFTADVVQASGLADPQFIQLVDLFLGRRDTVELDDTALTPLHLVLMDAAHLDISQAQLSALPASLLQARVSLRYLQRDAQLSVGFQALALGLSDLDEMAGLLRSQYESDQSIIQAASRIGAEDSSLNGLVRSNLYTQLSGALGSNAGTDDFDTLIAEALRFEAALGQAELLMPLYAEMIEQRMAAESMAPLSDGLLADFAVWVAIANPDSQLDSILAVTNPIADEYRALLALSEDRWTVDSLNKAQGWDWLPLLSARGLSMPDVSVQTISTGLELLPSSENQQVHPVHLLALQQAVADKKIGEAVLLAAKALEGQRLEQIRSTDLGQILTALKDVGLEDSARRIAGEALRARMLASHFAFDG